MCKQFECGESAYGFVQAENNISLRLRTNSNTKHVCLLIVKTESHQRKKSKQRTKRNSEEAKRAKFGSLCSKSPTLAATSLAALAGQCWQLQSDGAAPSWAWWQQLGADFLSVLPSSEVATEKNFTERGWL